MKLSIVTPTYNSEKYLKDTIESVLSQAGDFDIEYIFADGGSSDGTLKIIEYYKDQIDTGRYKIYCNSIEIKYFSEKDFGMYDAINKGFNLATGEIYAWINSDDVYLQGAFQIICTTFGKFPEIKWLKGITSFIKDDDLSIFKKGVPYIYSQDWITRGIYGRDTYFIQQDSVFWRKELWTMSGGANSKLKLAGDYDLWIRFAKHEPLWTINFEVSCFRKRQGQLSSNEKLYKEEQKSISNERGFMLLIIKLLLWIQNKLPTHLNQVFYLVYRIAFNIKKQYFIDIEKNNEPVKKQAYHYEILK